MAVIPLVPNQKLYLALWMTHIAYSCLLILFLVKIISHQYSWIFWLFQSLPLLILLPGLIKQRFRSYSWLCFVILAYFMAYVVEAGSPVADASDWLGLVLSVVIFLGAMMSSRYLQRL